MSADAVRELEKALDVLEACERHFTAEAEMNAALHLADKVRPAPLAARVSTAVAEVARAIDRLGPS